MSVSKSTSDLLSVARTTLISGIVGETSSTRLRAKTIALSRNFYYLWIVLSNVISPYMLNPTQWNLQGKTNFVWAPLATLLAVWGFFRLPEMKVGLCVDEIAEYG